MVRIAGDSVTQQDLDVATGRRNVGGAAYYNRPKFVRNRPPHPALTGSRPTWLGANPTRGKIVRYDQKKFDTDKGELVLNADSKVAEFGFIFNPTTISSSVTTNPDAAADSIATDVSIPFIGAVSLSFSLMIDRTFEVLEKPGSKWHMPKGVLDDLFVLESLTGVQQADTSIVGHAQMTPCRVIFGGADSFEFVGYPSSVSYEITHFSPAMVPTRMAVQLAFVRQFNSAVVAGSGLFLEDIPAYVKRGENPKPIAEWKNFG